MINPRCDYLITELTNLRVEARINRPALALRLGISVAALKNWEDKTTSPTANNLVAWAEALGYEFDLHPLENKRRHYV
jgi:transcriptional regulator with XRE-family HTH domain